MCSFYNLYSLIWSKRDYHNITDITSRTMWATQHSQSIANIRQTLLRWSHQNIPYFVYAHCGGSQKPSLVLQESTQMLQQLWQYQEDPLLHLPPFWSWPEHFQVPLVELASICFPLNHWRLPKIFSSFSQLGAAHCLFQEKQFLRRSKAF